MAWMGLLVLGACSDPPPANSPPLPDALLAKDVSAVDVAPVKEVHWALDATTPAVVGLPAVPSCTTPWTFALPPLPPPEGNIGMETGSAMSAVGLDEKLFLYVILPGKSTLDTAADGPLQLTADPGVQVVSVANAQHGIGSAVVRFKTEGQHAITAAFGDGRSGTAGFYAYTTPLPVWQISIADEVWKAMKANPYLKEEHPCTLAMGATVYGDATIRLHGGSSVDLPKKSFQIKLKNGAKLPDGRTNLILRSEFIDKTLARTWLGYQAFSTATWLPVPKSEFVHARVNQSFYGVMHVVEHIDSHYLQLRGRDKDGVLYEGDPSLQLANPGANFTPMFPPTNYPLVYQKHGGTKSYADLIEFIEVVLQAPDATLFSQLELYLKVRDWMEYAAMMTVLQNREHIRKNWYAYRSPTSPDDRFELLAWDLDITWGHLWSEKFDVLDEAINSDLPPDTGNVKVDPKFYNQLYRILDNPAWRKVWAQRVLALADVVLDDKFVQPRLNYLQCLLAADVVADGRKRGTTAEYVSRLAEIAQFAKDRRAFLHKSLGTP